jgi:nucleoside-diphosphate-sugar epimerase
VSRVAITGATGYLGSVIANSLSRHGNIVVALTRSRPADFTAAQWHRFNLSEPISENALQDIDVLIHAAWVLGGKDQNDLWQQNVVGSRRLIESAVAKGIPKIVFISSMSAFFGTQQTYGLMKLAVERTALDSGCVVVRPGLVYGDMPGGMAGTLRKVSMLPVWPRFRTASQFLAHQDDIAAGILSVLHDYDGLQGQTLGFANAEPLGLASILTGLSPKQRRRPEMPIPASLVMALLRVAETANIPLPFRSDSLLGLVEPAHYLPGKDLLAARGIRFRSFSNTIRSQDPDTSLRSHD